LQCCEKCGISTSAIESINSNKDTQNLKEKNDKGIDIDQNNIENDASLTNNTNSNNMIKNDINTNNSNKTLESLKELNKNDNKSKIKPFDLDTNLVIARKLSGRYLNKKNDSLLSLKTNGSCNKLGKLGIFIYLKDVVLFVIF
jgi:hypothetical protein